jgi:hypothetical protein
MAGRLTGVSTSACMAAWWSSSPSGGATPSTARLERRHASFARSRRTLLPQKKGAREERSGSPARSRAPTSGGGRRPAKSAPYLADRGSRRHDEDGRMKAEAEVRAKAKKRSFMADNGVAALVAPATVVVMLLLRARRSEGGGNGELREEQVRLGGLKARAGATGRHPYTVTDERRPHGYRPMAEPTNLTHFRRHLSSTRR